MIDEEKTYREKGYRSTDLKPKSSKPVYAVCEGENCNYGRWVRFCQYHDLCNACAKKKNRKHNYDDNVVRSIDEDKTFLEKGYRSIDLSAQSNKEVWAICIECGNGRWVRFCQYKDLCPSCAKKGDKCYNWKGGISIGKYCKFFDNPLKDAVRNYFDNLCFECDGDIEKNKCRKMSVHHINYQKNCGCDNTQFCVYIPLCNSCHGKSSNGNRWYWYLHFMTELALRNPNYYAYHIPVVYYDEPCYNYAYVFEKNRTRRE